MGLVTTSEDDPVSSASNLEGSSHYWFTRHPTESNQREAAVREIICVKFKFSLSHTQKKYDTDCMYVQS